MMNLWIECITLEGEYTDESNLLNEGLDNILFEEITKYVEPIVEGDDDNILGDQIVGSVKFFCGAAFYESSTIYEEEHRVCLLSVSWTLQHI